MVQPGVRLNEYEVIAKLGAGGMGEVFLARDMRLDRTVALKVLYVDAEGDTSRLDRFATEAKAASALNHPNVASVYGIGQCGAVCYIAMEHIKGKTLKQLQLSPEEVRDVALQAASALEAAHAAGVIHRDIKPANIMRTESGLVKVLDFGLAKRLSLDGINTNPDLTCVGTVMGTLGYMSPEQLLGQQMDVRTDIFSLGVVFYELLTNKLPFASTSYQTALSELVGSAVPPTCGPTGKPMPSALAPVVLRCIERDPDRRFQTVTELIAALRAVDFGQPALVAVAVPIPVAALKKSRRSWLIAGAATAAVGGFAGAAWKLDLLASVPTGPLNSLAVLPFASDAGNAEMEYLRDGIAESLMNRLSSTAGLRVISRDSAFRYRGQEARAAGRKLAVRGVVTGAIHKLDNALIVNAELIDSGTGDRVWGDEFRGSVSDVLALRDRIATAIAGQLKGQLTPRVSAAPTVEATPENPKAHDLYLRGRFHTAKIDADELRRGIGYLDQAVAVDPCYALAHAATAEAHILVADLFVSAKDVLPLARRSAKQALACNPKLSEAQTVDAMVAMAGDLDWRRAEAGFRQAIALNANLPVAHSWLGWVLSATGRTEVGLAESRLAVALEPRSPLGHATLAANLYFTGSYAESFSEAGAALELDPQFHLALLWRGLSMIARGVPGIVAGKLEEARKTVKVPFVTATLGRAYAAAGKMDKARALLLELTKTAETQHVSAIVFAQLHAALGDKPQALDALERAYETRSKMLLWTGRDPVFRPLHGNSKFAALLQQMNLPIIS